MDIARQMVGLLDRFCGGFAAGTETATTGATISSHPYRMTMVATRRSGHWSLVQVHGSSPHDSSPAEPPTHATT